MNYTDFDLDTYNSLKTLPECNSVLYFRSGAEGDWDDFFYATGDLERMAETLAGLMDKNADLEWMVLTAANIFVDEKED